jgi:hypothetical protein
MQRAPTQPAHDSLDPADRVTSSVAGVPAARRIISARRFIAVEITHEVV